MQHLKNIEHKLKCMTQDLKPKFSLANPKEKMECGLATYSSEECSIDGEDDCSQVSSFSSSSFDSVDESSNDKDEKTPVAKKEEKAAQKKYSSFSVDSSNSE